MMKTTFEALTLTVEVPSVLEGSGDCPDTVGVEVNVYPLRLDGLVFGYPTFWLGGLPASWSEPTLSGSDGDGDWIVCTALDLVDSTYDPETGEGELGWQERERVNDLHTSLPRAVSYAQAEYGMPGVILPTLVADALTDSDRCRLIEWLAEVNK
jgi:hypothetical protein